MLQVVSVTPAGSYDPPAAIQAGSHTSGSWTYALAMNRSPIQLIGAPLRIVRSLATVRLRFTARVVDDAGDSAAGVPVTFTTATLPSGSVGCTATTGPSGEVTCTATAPIPTIALVRAPTYRIEARQSNFYLAGEDEGRIIWR